MIPPAATALTTSADVQLAGVPLPTTRVGLLVSTARPAAGTAACPFGLPAFIGATGLRVVGGAAVVGATGAPVVGGALVAPGLTQLPDAPSLPHPASAPASTTRTTTTGVPRERRIRQMLGAARCPRPSTVGLAERAGAG
jgi:hypothetical protein